MWQWFTINSIWFLSAAALGGTALIFVRNRFRDKISKLKPDQRDTRRNRVVSRVFLVILWALVALVLVSVVAIIFSGEGVNDTINPDDIQEWLLKNGIVILAYIIVGYIAYRLIKLVIPRLMVNFVKARGKGRHTKSWFEKRAATLSGMVTWICGLLIGIITVFMILPRFNVNITPLLASAGVVGVAIGFGAQNLIKDFLGGMFILLEDQYNTGDVVKIAGIAGSVEEINLRRTVLRDLDGIVHSVPNGAITTTSNYTRDWARVNLDVPVAYGEDLDNVFAVINRVGNEMAADDYFGKLIKTPPQVLRVQNFGDSGIDIRILGNVRPMTQWEVTGELRKRLKKAFDEAGIEIPWPHVKLFFGGNTECNNVICKACSKPNAAGSKFCSNCGGKLE